MVKMINKSIKDGIISMFKVNFKVKPSESILILSDYPTEDDLINLSTNQINEMIQRIYLARDIYEVGINLGYNIFLKLYPATGQSGKEIPNDIADLMLKYDIFIAITTYSLTHTTARLNATENMKRGASCPGILPQMFGKEGPMQVDYNLISKFTIDLAEKVNEASKGLITAPNGTNVEFRINPKSCEYDTGIIDSPGDFSNLPAGEAYLAPMQNSTNGTLVVSKGWFKGLKKDMSFKIENGLVQSIEGGGEIGEKFNNLLFSKNIDELISLSRRNIAEIGIGTNPNAKNPLNILEAEKIKGTCHVAIGDNHTFSGGTVESDIHIDFVIPNARLFLDEEEIKLN